jgi:hypothetical protein
MIKLKKLILEKPEANPDDIFGKYLFGSERSDEPASNEDDTELEEEFWYALDNHFGSYAYNNELQKIFPKILKLVHDGKYAKLLKPRNKKCYRLLYNVPEDKAQKILGLTYNQVESIRNTQIKPHVINNSEDYENLEGTILSSWTSKLNFKSFESVSESASIFRHTNVNSNEYIKSIFIIILEANIENNKFLVNPVNFNKYIPHIFSYEDEFETIGYGKIKINRASFVCISPENVKQSMKEKDKKYLIYLDEYLHHSKVSTHVGINNYKVIKSLISSL